MLIAYVQEARLAHRNQRRFVQLRVDLPLSFYKQVLLQAGYKHENNSKASERVCTAAVRCERLGTWLCV